MGEGCGEPGRCCSCARPAPTPSGLCRLLRCCSRALSFALTCAPILGTPVGQWGGQALIRRCLWGRTPAAVLTLLLAMCFTCGVCPCLAGGAQMAVGWSWAAELLELRLAHRGGTQGSSSWTQVCRAGITGPCCAQPHQASASLCKDMCGQWQRSPHKGAAPTQGAHEGTGDRQVVWLWAYVCPLHVSGQQGLLPHLPVPTGLGEPCRSRGSGSPGRCGYWGKAWVTVR